MEFVAKYKKQYASSEEWAQRFEAFKANLRMVQEHNAIPDAPFKLEVNRFADGAETTYYPNETLKLDQGPPMPPPDMMEVDWRSNSGMVQDQLACNAGWAFTAADLVESAISIRDQTFMVDEMSVQYIVECDNYNRGCRGGSIIQGINFLD